MLSNISRNISSTTVNALVRVLCRQKSGLSICHINAQSLRRKIEEFKFVFENSNVDVICVSETWFTEETLSDMVSINGYKLFRADRKGHAGGVAVYIKRGISCKVILSSNCNDSFRNFHKAKKSITWLFIPSP